MSVRRALLLFPLVVPVLVACGGAGAPATEWVGTWRTAAAVPGSFTEMTLSGSGTTITGSGVEHVEAGPDRPFTVQGTSIRVPGWGVTVTYADQTTEAFVYGQPDPDHLTLSGLTRTLAFTRQ